MNSNSFAPDLSNRKLCRLPAISITTEPFSLACRTSPPSVWARSPTLNSTSYDLPWISIEMMPSAFPKTLATLALLPLLSQVQSEQGPQLPLPENVSVHRLFALLSFCQRL